MTHGAWPLQQELHHRRKRFNVIVAHRRFGKTVLGISELLHAAAKTKRKAARYAYLAPFQRQAKAVVWDMLKEQARSLKEPRFHEGELRCDLKNGARISLYGGDDPDSLRGIYLDGQRAQIARLVSVGPTRLRVVLRQGVNRQIRRMFYEIGYEVERLLRTRVGTLRLGDLPRGNWRPLTRAELTSLRSVEGRGPSQKFPAIDRRRL